MEYLLINECQSQSARGTQIAMTCVQVGHRVQSTLHRARSTLHAACRVQLINGFGYTLPCYFVVSGRQSPNAFGQKLGEIVAGPIAIRANVVRCCRRIDECPADDDDCAPLKCSEGLHTKHVVWL
jgi:hypothetical protein